MLFAVRGVVLSCLRLILVVGVLRLFTSLVGVVMWFSCGFGFGVTVSGVMVL